MPENTVRRSSVRGAARLLATFGAIVLVLACGGSDGGSGTLDPIDAVIHPNGTASEADLVRLTGTADGDEAEILVVIGGPTTSDDLYSFVFDLAIGDPDVLEYVDGSATFGDALTLDPGEDGEVLAEQIGDRVVIGISKLAGAEGNGVAVAEATVVSLRFRVLRRGELTTLTIAGYAPDDPAALDSTGTAIDSVSFDGSSLGVSGQ